MKTKCCFQTLKNHSREGEPLRAVGQSNSQKPNGSPKNAKCRESELFGGKDPAAAALALCSAAAAAGAKSADGLGRCGVVFLGGFCFYR